MVIIVDEAQNLSSAALEELRLLSCIDTSDRRIVSIVLTGQPGLDDLLDAPGLIQLRQRARLRQKLDALVEAETLDYIRHRLEVAGGDADAIFEPGTLEEIHRLTYGIPRLINTLCDTALMACMVEERHTVNVDVIDAVVQELRWQWFEEHGDSGKQPTAPKSAPQDGDNAVTLMVYRSGVLIEQVQARSFPFVIGRSNANDLVVIDKEVSRRHALIDCIGGIYVIEDLNSRNGIMVNQKRRARALLRAGDIITCGQAEVVFYVDHPRRSQVTAIHADAARAVPEALPEDTARQATLSDEGSGAFRLGGNPP